MGWRLEAASAGEKGVELVARLGALLRLRCFISCAAAGARPHARGYLELVQPGARAAQCLVTKLTMRHSGACTRALAVQTGSCHVLQHRVGSLWAMLPHNASGCTRSHADNAGGVTQASAAGEAPGVCESERALASALMRACAPPPLPASRPPSARHAAAALQPTEVLASLDLRNVTLPRVSAALLAYRHCPLAGMLDARFWHALLAVMGMR